MLKLNILFIFLCACLGVCVGQYEQDRQCDSNIELVDNFKIEDFVGTWYEIQRTNSAEQNADCSHFEISTTTNNAINVLYNGVNNNFQENARGNATLTSNTAKMTLDITMFDSPKDFWVLLTDYNNFAVTYSCENISATRSKVYIWVLGRARAYPNELIPAFISTRLDALLGINLASLSTINHSETACYVLPVIEPGESVILPGQCNPNIPVQQNFDVAAFTGTWHEISSYYTESSNGSCIRAEYTLGDGVVNVLNSQVINQALFTITGTAAIASNDSSAKLNVKLNVTPELTVEQDLWVISTDYRNYAISYSCENLDNNQKRIYSWIVSRNRELSPEAQAVVNEVIDSIVELNANYYMPTNQSPEGCFYFPEPNNLPVIFRGQCNMSIPAKSQFNPVAYMGLWHDIQSYPTPFQGGTCGNAYYELVDGVVQVFNTQVINERLDTIRGTADLASDDGTAKLKVTFPIGGSNQISDYWVLDTDYRSFALVYSCTNIDNDRMQVSSWKLSRTKSLTPAANARINDIMNNIPVLDQRYYLNIDQSANGCFYFPETQPGVPVVFPGQCDNNINTVQNFDFSRFQGNWYEIETYPKDEQTGQCIDHTYSFVSATQLGLVSSSVRDQIRNQTTGTVTGGSNGRLNIAIVSNGQTINIPFWILSTDYENYALAYACVNQNTDFRAVWSWKLSRNKTLSATVETTINNAIDSIDVLDNRYYEIIDQSDDACFYLPDIPAGQPVVFPGQCDTNIPVVQNFNASRYLGRWRLIQTYHTEFQNGTCNEATYSPGPDGSVVVYNTQVVNGQLDSITGSAVLATTDGSGKLLVTFPTSDTPSEYWILDTDYESYALVYSCLNLDNNRKRVWSWKMSRTNTLTNAANAAINQVVNRINVLNERYYQTVDRSEAGCFYFPEPDSSTSVRFRGQCNQNIDVVTNFDAVRYMGLWHDIQSYPDPFQDGTCNNAYYSLRDGVVDVFNTQVINQQLDTITGTAVLASNDGSAKLNVTFNVGGIDVTTNYWVLSTDYRTYSFVYSCRPIDDEYVQVSSWKLSRTKSLTDAANVEINRVMNNTQVLDQRYYINRDQSPNGCFYFPEPQPGVPIVFPGQCDNNINTIQNFDFSRFQGNWYEIEAYPKDEQTGQCIDHTYSFVSATQLGLVSSSVRDQIRNQTTGTVTGGSNGRLNIAIVSNGQTINIPFWILSTDYENYALAYACVNQNTDFRAVWSWKLSRNKTLSATVETTINNAIDSIDVLDNRYYEIIDQSDDACFYLPDIPAGQPVVFPGQCDTNIPVVQNFNASRYLGRWRLIQTYHTEFQNGTCNEATYSPGPDGSVVVYNTQVVNGQLDSITGSAVLATTDGSGKLLVTFPTSDTPSEYWILDTDYESYALVYSCLNLDNNRKRVWSWKMSRTNTLTNAANAAINQVVNRINVLNERYYQTVDRSEAGCFYFPEPDSSTSVRFRGQCNQNIDVVTNFDAVRYMGLWHDIQSYPDPFQDGTCNNAYYSLRDGVVDVFNTQVINQQLDTITGTAVLASNDGSAKLNVTFNVGGIDVTTNYWVLSTDYRTYSFVYSCRPIDDEYVQVSSWKLSRTKSLTDAANVEINRVMNNTQVLDQRYYINRDQSPNGCFYFPEPQPGVPIVFPGQCDNNINTIQNFDFSRFQGNWYEIEAYPKDEQTGQCIDHTYSFVSTTQIGLESSSVRDQIRNLTTGTVTGDSNGRLNITIESNGQTINIPFWILSIDYDNYTLAYACVNQNTDFRAVWSWKLSRSKVLSTTAVTAINNAIANIDVLDNRYYEKIDQSDEACFYLPDIPDDQPVVLPGQCDTNIPVVQNFNASMYLGRWRLIQTYYDDFQLGSCQEATYSPNDDGSVMVYNTEVVNQQLESITGTAVLATTDGSGKLLVSFPTANATSEYWILGTDYASYALVYSCQNIDDKQRRVWSWKMSRTNSLTSDANSKINEIVNSINVLNDRYYQTVNRSDNGCFYYPIPDENTSVVFRGQCDLSIPAFPNFEAARYLGFWYDLQSYPAPFQTGTCNKAQYTLNDDGSVRVENTQVVNQVLETWIGSAVVDSDDGSAKLSVTFNIDGINVTTKYWVLSTDYDSYAYVYSCQNIDDERRSVFSWKLSRNTTLPAAANENITEIMNTVQVLDERYYVNRGHTEEDCFYYPDNNGGDVILTGQCVENSAVPAVTNFNINSFAGTWHEVSRFPSSNQNGECTSTQYTVSGANSYIVAPSIVNNERLINTTTQGSVSNDGRGVITLDFGGVPFNDLYVLATDYAEYALTYGCNNINDTHKQIYSWKLSRSRSGLSDAANAAINRTVSDNIDLWEGYYRPTAQDNDACFYYPTFDDQLPEFITLPGPCPNNIVGVANFSAADYLGRWYETARYPTRDQNGQCSRAEYVLGTNRVNVSNTEVAEQTLFTQTGFADVISTDGSGVLGVEFVVGGVVRTLNYYILTTDYTNYSLVYSCTNLDNETRIVSSWKLSRTPTLSASASAIMEEYINKTQGLIEEYYLSTSQSDEACFYVPEVNEAEAPLFPGQCENINGVADFDIQRYLGWWHEVERYPVDGTAGECRSSEYTQDGNTYRVVDTSVQNNQGTTVAGTVVASSDGRLRRSISGRPVEDIWVLATDYETYALLYSCVNVNSEYRRVWSAKHSKSRSLTEAAQNAMAPAIANNRVLHPQFYLAVNQTDNVCFHYPTIIPDGQVIIPGQCDATIPVVSNFNVTNFAGTWYHTEMYDEVGSDTCVGSRYTVNQEVVTVLKFSVNGSSQLEIAEGNATVQSSDGSARSILLTFPGGDSGDATVTTTVSILQTDYTEYAVVYNCANVNAFRRQIRAWKLSRSRTMSTAGSSAIATLIASRQELHQPYFNQIKQDDDCEEPSSALIVKSSIIVLLVCAMLQWLL